MPKITLEEALAIELVKLGADVYAYPLAKTLRGLERRGVKGLVDIGKPRMYTGDGTDRMPYFGAIATPAGKLLARKTIREFKWNTAKTADHETLNTRTRKKIRKTVNKSKNQK
jgi:hypothetical protein